MTTIIAEAGTGHYSIYPDKRERLARKFVKAAADAGADAVKFQMFVPGEPLFCPLPGDEERMERWNNTALSIHDWWRVKQIANCACIDLLLSVFQPTAVEWLKELKPKYIKVASRAANTFPYDALPGPFLVSLGMAWPPAQVYAPPHGPVNLLQCSSKYPTPLEEAGYSGGHDGLSDHSGMIWPGLDAIARGAKFLEVHFKIPRADMGNDEPVCLTVEQLKLLCEARDAFAKMRQG